MGLPCLRYDGDSRECNVCLSLLLTNSGYTGSGEEAFCISVVFFSLNYNLGYRFNRLCHRWYGATSLRRYLLCIDMLSGGGGGECFRKEGGKATLACINRAWCHFLLCHYVMSLCNKFCTQQHLFLASRISHKDASKVCSVYTRLNPNTRFRLFFSPVL